MPAVHDHFRPVAADIPDGVYRVVGTSEDDVTLLRVADAAGRRIHSGTVISLPGADLEAFESADNPDGNRSTRAFLASKLDGIWWSFRLYGQTIRDRSIPSAVALALVALGVFGDASVSIPAVGDTLLILAGVFFMIYLVRTNAD